MGFDVSLQMNGQSVQVESHTHGSIYVVGGTTDAEMSVTYNYSHLWPILLGRKPDSMTEDNPGYGLAPWIHGKKAADCQRLFEEAIEKWKAQLPYQDYWAPTIGNALAVIKVLHEWGTQYPDAVWVIDGG